MYDEHKISYAHLWNNYLVDDTIIQGHLSPSCSLRNKFFMPPTE